MAKLRTSSFMGRHLMVRVHAAVMVVLPLCACGARTELAGSAPASVGDGGDGDASSASTSCVDTENATAAAATDCTVGGSWVAWLYIPASSGELTAIEMHTVVIPVAFLDGQNPAVAATVFQTQLGSADAQGWRAATAPFAEPLIAGHRYWIAISGSDTSSVPCPAAASGTDIETWVSHGDLGGPWHQSAVEAPWAARVRYTCP